MKFPLPLFFLASAATDSTFNNRFRELLDPAGFRTDVAASIAASPEAEWRFLKLQGRHGSAVSVRAQGLPVTGGVVIVIDDTPDAVSAGLIDGLRDRIAELERLSTTDRLTGVWNRAHLDRTAELEISRSVRTRHPVSLVLIDIDRFKHINDTYGHLTGDEVLRDLVRVVRSNIRTADMAFRWGGEEFVVLAASTGYRAAEVLAETLRRAVEAHRFSTAGHITISVGVAEHLATESADAWFARADAALYEAKMQGRNRTHTDRRGSSDVWASESGKSALHLVWLEAYECGEPTIDKQHRRLFELANAAISASMSTPGSAFTRALDQLLIHIKQHFQDEEAILERQGYAELTAHSRAHARLLSRAADLRHAVTGHPVSLGELVEFLANEVVARHLFTADRDFYPLFGQSSLFTEDDRKNKT